MADEVRAEDFDARKVLLDGREAELVEDVVEFSLDEAGVFPGGVGFEAERDAGLVIEAAGRPRSRGGAR